MSYFVKGQWKPDNDNRMSSHMIIISFPVLYLCCNALKEQNFADIIWSCECRQQSLWKVGHGELQVKAPSRQVWIVWIADSVEPGDNWMTILRWWPWVAPPALQQSPSPEQCIIFHLTIYYLTPYNVLSFDLFWRVRGGGHLLIYILVYPKVTIMSLLSNSTLNLHSQLNLSWTE